MSGFDQALVALRDERDQLTGRLRLVEKALEVLEDLGERAPARPGRAAKPLHLELDPVRAPAAGKGGWTCKACGQQGHTARSKECPKRAGAQTSAPSGAAKAFGGKAKPEPEPVKAELAGPADRLKTIRARAGAVLLG